MTKSIHNQLNDSTLKLSKSSQKVAEIVRQDPQWAINATIAMLATQAHVSEPTVNRFCHKMGCQGFPDFKVKLAQELARGTSKIALGVEMDDSTTQVIEKVFDATHASLSSTQAICQSDQISSAVDLMIKARSICFFGLGASSSVALDAQHKFLRFDVPVITHSDTLNQRMVAATLGKKDVVVCISYTGRTQDIIEVAQIAHQTNAHVIGITSNNSPLAKQCSLVLPIDTPEDTEIYTPMTSRINHLILIDILATSFALKKGTAFNQHLQKVKQSLSKTRVS